MKNITTERLNIRKIIKEDALKAHQLFTDDDAMRFLALYPPFKNLDETNERIEEWMNDDEHFAIVDRNTNEFVGYVAVNSDSEEDREDTKELGFGIIASERNKGYAFEAIKAVLDELQKFNIKYVWACCFEGNDASKALIEKLGFDLMNIGTFEVENDREYKSFEFRKTI